jgi:hypothetical protein
VSPSRSDGSSTPNSVPRVAQRTSVAAPASMVARSRPPACEPMKLLTVASNSTKVK